ncbi:uncharacterized protein LOC109857044 [Pseudomyrmex gracilis]|uniref:uncharacterized protein LOC109857044 n=1 Tax=Pseudomyrmex gracilis TaxID=219809 RepID=UPI0009952A4B|nr:uncharacterized protein LOC109857044 [Pseudomyrmex gracilis]
MSAIEEARKIVGKQRSVGFATESKKTRTPPRFLSHTQSSLMKMRTPINLKKKLSSAIKDRESRSCVFKRRSGRVRQRSRSVLALKMILDQHHRATRRSLSGDVLTETTRPQSKRYTDNFLVSLENDLIKDISNIIKCARSPIKLASRIVGRSEARAEDSNDSLDVTCSLSLSSVSVREELDSNSVRDFSEDSTVVASGSRSDEEIIEEKESARSSGDVDVSKQIDAFKHEDNEEPRTLPNREEAPSSTSLQTDEIKVLHRRSSHRRFRETDSSNENNIETQVCRQTTTNRKYTRRIWKKRKAKNEETEFKTGSQNSTNSTIARQIDNSQDTRANNSDAKSARRRDGQRKFNNFANRRAWRPAGIGKYSNAENTASSTQVASQKSSRSMEKPVAPMRNKHSSVEQVESFDSGSTNASMSASQSKMLKENRDPGREAREQHDQQKKGLQKRKRWTWKVPNDSGKDNEVGSRWQHWRSFTPRSPKDSNDNEQNFSESVKIRGRRTRPTEMINALKEIINSVSDDEDARENVASASDTDVFQKIDNETPPSRDAEMPIDDLATTGDSNEAETTRSCERSSCKSIGTQTESNTLSRGDLETDVDSEKISKQTRTVAAQTSPCGKTETGCNTTSYGDICRDAEVSCDLIGSSNVRATVAIEKASNESENNAIHVTNIYDSDNVYDVTIVDPDSPLYDSSNPSDSDIRNDVVREETENVLSDDLIENMKMIFELAAERARNLREAVVIYYESLMSREDQNEEIRYDEEPSRDHRYRLERCASFTSSASVEEIGDSDGERFVASDDDFDDGRSSSSASSGQTFVSVIRNSRANVQIIDRDDGNARSSLNESLEGSKSLMRLVCRRTRKEHALELLQFGNDGENLGKEMKILTLPVTEKPSILTRENLLPLVCCALCTVVVWWLQFLFRCHSDK